MSQPARPRPPLTLPSHRAARGLVVFLVKALAAAALAQTSAPGPVTITGGRDDTGQNYTWIVRNALDTPLVWIEFPHYRADLFTAPDGWDTAGTTNLQNVGVAETSGVCRAAVKPGTPGVIAGTEARFTMRIARGGPHPGTGSVRVGLADGRELVIAGVDLPTPPSLFQQYGTAIAVALLLGVFIAFRLLRGRRPAPAERDMPE